MSKEAFLVNLALVFEVDTDVLNDSYELNSDNWDSVNVVSTIGLIDQYFGITLRGTVLEHCRTLGELFELIDSKQGE